MLFIYLEFYLKSSSDSRTIECPMLDWQGIVSLNARRGLRKTTKSWNQYIRKRQIESFEVFSVGTDDTSRCSGCLDVFRRFGNNFRPSFSMGEDLDSAVGIATGYGLDGPWIESRCGSRFSAPVQTGPGDNRVIPGGKAAGAWRWPPTLHLSITRVKERVELYLYCPLGLRGLF
jgi:hypothetical protein